MRGSLSRAAEFYNYAEVGVWCCIGVAVGALALRRTGSARRNLLVASITLIVFGISDYVENRTGGEWWTPWWLLAWKATCVLILLALLLVSRRKGSPNIEAQS
jgi:hypothetical protein